MSLTQKLKCLFLALIMTSCFSILASTLVSQDDDLYMIGTDGRIYTRTLQNNWSEYLRLPNNLKAVAIAIGILETPAPYNGFNIGENVQSPYLVVIADNGRNFSIDLESGDIHQSAASLPPGVAPLATAQ